MDVYEYLHDHTDATEELDLSNMYSFYVLLYYNADYNVLI